MDPLTTAKTKLAKVGYSAWQKSVETDRVYFEDRSVFGMVTTYPSVRDLIDTYEDRQDQFLRANESALRAASNQDKVWNAYTVHLTVGDFPRNDKKRGEQENQIFRIEENFRGTRKIVRTNVATNQDVVDALLPLLPIQRKAMLAAEDYRQQLARNLRAKYDGAFLRILDKKASPEDIVGELLQNQGPQNK